MAELSWLIDPVYIVTIFFFIVGMQRMSHPLTARSGIVWAGAAMLIATLVTFFSPNLTNLALIAIAIVIGSIAILHRSARPVYAIEQTLDALVARAAR